MNLAIQYGYGMKELCKELLSQIPGMSIILSPRDLSDKQIINYSNEFVELGGRTFIDSQLYAPHSDHKQLTKHAYWPTSFSTGMFMEKNHLRKIIRDLSDLNKKAGASRFILPGVFCSDMGPTWKDIQDHIFSVANEVEGDKIATIVLSSQVIRDIRQVDNLIEYLADCPYNEVYLLVEHPNGDYLVQDPLWLTNFLYVSASIKRINKRLIVGYGNQQLLCLGLADIDELASGTWLNVRSFSLSKFFENDDVKRKNTWYYCPQAFTEYTLVFLDLAFQQQILPPFKQNNNYSSNYANILFSGALPSTTAFSEPLAFRHYLLCLYDQCKHISEGNFNNRVKLFNEMLAEANKVLDFARSHSISGQKRDFCDCIEVVQASVDTFVRTHGPLLSRLWR